MARGDVLLVSLPPSDRREQSGRRPAVAVQTDQKGEPMLMVAPITSNLAALRFAFTVSIEPSPDNGLSMKSVVMVFQMRALAGVPTRASREGWWIKLASFDASVECQQKT